MGKIENKMSREDAIEYLDRKSRLDEPKYNRKDEKQIAEVMRSGKIYGDPIVELEDKGI